MTAAVVRSAPPGRGVLRWGPVSFLVPWRALVVGGVVAVLLAVAVVASLSLSGRYVAPGDVVAVLLGQPSPYDVVVLRLRLPRIMLAVAVGAAFGLAGALIQGIARNPLASPDVVGVTQGAGLVATVGLSAGLSMSVLSPLALVGGLAAAGAVLLIAGRHGLAAHRFVLAGIAVAVALKALIEVVIVSADAIEAQRAQIWLLGSLAGRGHQEAVVIAAVGVVLLPALLWAGRALAGTALDDDTARGLGIRVAWRRAALGATGVTLAATATAQVGAVDFVALVAPQVARRLVRAERPPLACAALVGALLVVVADLVARRAFAPVELPVGVFTAALGGPYLLWLIVRERKGGTR